MPTERFTCQICGRVIKVAIALIAHHGYQRPGQGWQTRSCFGARWRPYEVACDALLPAIESCERFIAVQEVALAKLIAEPPATMQYDSNRRSWGKPEYIDVPRPDNFDPERSDYAPGSYVSLYHIQKHSHERHIETGRGDLAKLRRRLADWVPPSRERADHMTNHPRRREGGNRENATVSLATGRGERHG